jgi:serine/threonine protein kinase
MLTVAAMTAARAPWLERLVGRTLLGRYRLDRIIGAGAHGTVFAGHHLWLNVPIAMKVLHALDHAPNAERFVAEARMLAQLRHPHIVSVLDAGILAEAELPQVPWTVMEWCDGQSLSDYLGSRRGQGATISQCVGLVRPLVDALAFAHGRGIIHRDLKPSNVMLARDASGGVSARVLDFGIAKVMEVGADPTGTGTATATRSFTPAYAAPEQVAGDRTGPWTDVHAIGLLMTEILCGRPPYAGTTHAELHGAVFSERRPTPALHGVHVGALEPVIATAVAARPDARYADASQLMQALDAAAAHSGATPVSYGPPASAQPAYSAPAPSTGVPLTLPATTTAPSPKRLVWPWIVLAALLVTGTVGGGAVLLLGSQTTTQGKKKRSRTSASAAPSATATVTPTATTAPTAAAAGIDGATVVQRLRTLGWTINVELHAPTFGCDSHQVMAMRERHQATVTVYHCVDSHAAQLVHENLAVHPNSAALRPFSAFALRGADVLWVMLGNETAADAAALLAQLTP